MMDKPSRLAILKVILILVFLSPVALSALSLGLFESIKPSYGFGLRVKLDKHSRTNLAVDMGFGQQSMGFYLAVSETF